MLALLVAALLVPAARLALASEGEATPQASLTASTGACDVTLSYDDAACLPEGATLEVSLLDERSQAYGDAREAVVAAKRADAEDFDEGTLGLLALDIRILDARGGEVEPASGIEVTLEVRDLPDETAGQSLEVLHVPDGADAAETVAEGVEATGGEATAEFAVDGFSTFAITWTQDSSSAVRVGGVRLHTVASDGTELEDTDTYTTSELSRVAGESGILVLSDWPKTTERADGYGYAEARLGSVDGTVVTGLKVSVVAAAGTESYALQYTSDATVGSSSTWTDVTDALSGAGVNGADVFLVFAQATTPTTPAVPVNLHFMTLTGEAIANEGGTAIVHTIDATEHTAEYDLTEYAIANAPEGYAFDRTQMNTNTTSRCQMILQTSDGTQALGSVRGTYYRYLRYQDGSAQMARGDKRWVTIGGSSIDVYVTFRAEVHLTVHYVDASGTELAPSVTSSFTLETSSFADAWDGYTISGQSDFDATIDGYTHTADYLGGTLDDAHEIPSGYALQYRYDTSTASWQTGIGESATGTPAEDRTFEGCLTDVYRVYAKDPVTFAVHYVDERKNALDGQADASFSLSGSDGADSRQLDATDLAPAIDGKYFVGSYLGVASSSLTENASYVTTDYQHVSEVRIDDGKAHFLLSVAEEPMALDMTRANRWAHTTAAGRTFILRREVSGSGTSESVRLSLVDDQVGTTATDLSLRSTSTTASGTVDTYVGSVETENRSVVYTITATTTAEASATTTEYALSVAEWVQSDLTDIYQVYASTEDASLASPAIEIKNDLVYSGHLIVQMAPGLEAALANAGSGVSDVSYAWYKSVNGGDFVEVERTESGYTWNIARNESERTWLDLAADDGALSSTRSSVVYRCVLSYTYAGTTYEATSNELSMINYDELINGGFETPTTASASSQIANSDYYSRGVWRTTGSDQKIEIVNTRYPGGKTSYYWNPSLDFVAADGKQFAELNAEAAGALYQDVVTLHYETLNYWLSHRARGKEANATAEYDTMYLVIMPTKLAMTSGSDGGELTEQSELQKYIESHGGFATEVATGEESVVTYRDEESGILIERISSSDQAWHTVSVANGYTAMAGLTRFFFVAGPTASGSSTVGNFLDGVGFSQQLQEPEDGEFQMVVTKTFSNLSLADIAEMADGADDPFTLTIRAYETKQYAEDRDETYRDASAALDGATLTFAVASDGSVTLEATKDGADLFAQGNGSGGTATANDDAGTVTLTWTLLANRLSDDADYYVIDETGEGLAGYTCLATQSGSVEHHTNSGGTSTTTTDTLAAPYVMTVGSQDVVRMSFTNAYNHSSLIRVEKVFSGITPITVRELASAEEPYTITLTRTGDDTSALQLVYDEDRPYTGELPEGVDAVSVEFRQGTGGTSILTWTVSGWDAGSYSVSESGYHPTGEVSRYNTLAGVTVNGTPVAEDESANTATATGVVVGGASAATLVPQGSTGVLNIPSSGTASLSGTGSSLLVAQYQNGDSTGYLVWTPTTAGANLRQAILGFIRQTVDGFGDSSASLDRISFYSSENPGTMQVNDATVAYDAEGRTLSFASSANTVWTCYCATSYKLTRNGEDVSADEAEIRLQNSYYPILKVQKIEAGHTDVPLSGATFRIYRLVTSEGGTERREYYLDAGSTVSQAAFGSGAARDFTTGDAGVVEVGVLSEGTYYLEETVAPNGYYRVAPIAFHVSEGGVVTFGDGSTSASKTSTAEVTLTNPYYTITVSDVPGASLPAAGGPGGLALSPAYLVALAAVALVAGVVAYRWNLGEGGGRP